MALICFSNHAASKGGCFPQIWTLYEESALFWLFLVLFPYFIEVLLSIFQIWRITILLSKDNLSAIFIRECKFGLMRWMLIIQCFLTSNAVCKIM